MNPQLFRFPLFDKTPAAAGGDGASTPAPAAPVEPKASDAPPEPTEPSTLQKVKAAVQSKGSLLAERDSAVTRAETAEAELATLQSQVETLTQENAALKNDLTEIETALTTSQSKNTTVSQAAQEKIVELGVAPSDLPAAQGEKGDFQARYKEAKDNGTMQSFLKENAAEVRQQLSAGA